MGLHTEDQPIKLKAQFITLGFEQEVSNNYE
jgi:hypothetical protein